MGLDVVAVCHLRLLTNQEAILDMAPEERSRRRYLNLYNEPEFAARLDSPQGYYSHGATVQFGAGSYGRYNKWRNHLAVRFGGYPSIEDVWRDNLQGPFAELINFTDCDGALGARVCAKLLEDFRTHHDAVIKSVEAGETEEDFLYLYMKFMMAFSLAANDGAVKFC